MVDALVAWYGGGLERQTIDRFHRLDTGLEGMAGQAIAMVVRSRHSNRRPFTVDSRYWLGIVTGEPLVFNLMKGECHVPTERHWFMDREGVMVADKYPLAVTKIYACGYDDEHRFLAYGPINLAKDYAVDGRMARYFDPSDYLNAEQATESRKPPIEVVLGTDRVRDYIENDSRLSLLAANPANTSVFNSLG